VSLTFSGLQTGGATAGVAITPSSVTLNVGSAAAPTLNFAGDTTTGLFRSAAGVLGISTGGVSAMTVALAGSGTGFLLSGVGTTGLISISSTLGTFLQWSTNSLAITSTNLAWRPGGADLGGFDSAGAVRSGAVTIPDASGTPGNATQNTPRGRAAFAGTASTCVITNSEVTADSVVMVILETANDATLTFIRGVAPGAGSFTVTGNAAATGTVIFRWFIVK